jgi:Asp-tRNA(Asn)/Glu-tRNA(Gln) amidotransferase C subunit
MRAGDVIERTAILDTSNNMKDAVQRLNAEYGLNLTEEEMEVIAKQAEAARRLVQRLYEVDTEGVVPAVKIDPAEKR